MSMISAAYGAGRAVASRRLGLFKLAWDEQLSLPHMQRQIPGQGELPHMERMPPPSSTSKDPKLLRLAKRHPYLALGAGIGGLYGGYRMLANKEPSPAMEPPVYQPRY